MLHHVVIAVKDIHASKAFYLAALKPLGYEVKKSVREGRVVGLGSNYYDFWLTSVEDAEDKTPTLPFHLAFAASTREQVRQFHAAALAAGGKCNGPPGLRTHYDVNYYTAYVLDAEGRNIEAVCDVEGTEE